MQPKVTAIILNWNGKEFLLNCFKSIFKNDYKNFDVILLDNGSTDGSIEFMKKHFFDYIQNKKLKIVVSKNNLGFAGGNNEAYKHVSKNTKYVLLLNNDTLVNKNLISELVKLIRSDSKIGGVSSIDNNIKDFYQKYWYADTLSGEGIHYKTTDNKNKDFFESIGIAGCCFMFRKDLIKKPFDDDYFAYAEDGYLSKLLILKGYKLMYSTKTYFHHFTESTKKRSKKLNKFLLFHGTKNKLMNLFLFYETKSLIKMFPLIAISQLIQLVFIPSRIPFTFKAYWWLITHSNEIKKKRKFIQSQRAISDKEFIKTKSCKFYSELNPEIKLNIITRFFMNLMNNLNFVYCWFVGLRTREFFEKQKIKD